MNQKERVIVLDLIAEVKGLRQDNILCHARLEMFDQMMLLFRTRPDFALQSAGVDVIWQMEQLLAKKEEESNV